MRTFQPLDPNFPVSRQMNIDAGPIVLVNLVTMPPEDEETFIKEWTEHARFMKGGPGFISTQLHRALGESPTFLNYAVFESTAAWRDVWTSKAFQESLAGQPSTVISRPHLFRKVAIAGICTA